MSPRPLRVGIVGAGIAGLACARALMAGGALVRVLDKGRGPGGRVATRRTETASFDHGAQRFTARDAAFRAEVDGWRAAGVVAADAERAPGDPWLVPVPKASALPRHLAQGIDVVTSYPVDAVQEREGAYWLARGGDHEGPFDRVVLTAPAPQSAALLRSDLTQISTKPIDALSSIEYAPCWALLLELTGAPRDSPRIDELAAGAVALVAREDRKPGRFGPARVVVHASEEWSRAHLEDAPEDVIRALSAEAAQHPSLRGATVARASAHRWRYARVTRASGEPFLLEGSVGVAGDGMLGPRIELAWLSGRALAHAILQSG